MAGCERKRRRWASRSALPQLVDFQPPASHVAYASVKVATIEMVLGIVLPRDFGSGRVQGDDGILIARGQRVEPDHAARVCHVTSVPATVTNQEVVRGEVIDWLMQGDAAIRWQVMRDLLNAGAPECERERARIATTGWGKRLLALQCSDGRWTRERGPKGYRGLYTPKWTSTTYTLLLLRRLGLPPGHERALEGCGALVDGSQWLDDGSIAPWASRRTDVCVCAMVLGLLEWFAFDAPGRKRGLLRFLLGQQKADGGWNCDGDSRVGSVHSTLSTLEALQLRRQRTPQRAIEAAMKRGHEYLLARRLFRSLGTGQVIRPSFKLFSFPPRWYYDVLRALDHLQDAGVKPDKRASEALELLLDKRRQDGTWTLQNRHSGDAHFELEKVGAPSRWNTLRALRVLRWWQGASPTGPAATRQISGGGSSERARRRTRRRS